MKTIRLIHLVLLLLCCCQLAAQNKTITGKVVDAKTEEPIIGASVSVVGTSGGTITDLDGKFSISVASGKELQVSFIGFVTQTVKIGKTTKLNIILEEDSKTLDEVVVVAFGTQKKESMISSIETIRPAELKVPSSNLTTALAGRMSGIIAYQRSGEPGKDNADFFIRGVTTFGYKVDPLILIDGIETTTTELARLQPDDIAAFSILKDATATALYGARGANGVIQVATKEGKEGATKVSIRFENSFSSNTKDVELADPITFMQMANEAVRTRNPLAPLAYSREKIDNTIKGTNPYAYPANDWRELLVNDVTTNQRVNMNVSGGGKLARYYIAASFAKDNGNLKNNPVNGFNNNINMRTYQLRSNININLTKTTEAVVRLSGSFDDYRGPLDGGDVMYKKIVRSNQVLFPAYFPSEALPSAKHILYGNAVRETEVNYMNPYADLTKGYKDYSRSTMDAQFELKQDLAFILNGLSVRGLFNTSRYSYFDVKRELSPYYYNVSSYDKKTNQYSIGLLNEKANPTEYLQYNEGWKDIQSSTYIEAALSYNNTFGLNDVSGLLVYQQREKINANSGSLQKSLPYRNQGLSGRFTYSYDSRYMAEFNFGYNGSERFYKNERFGFFPAAGVAWMVSNEKFWKPLSNVVQKLKLKTTYGLVGNDAIGDENDRFFYLSEVNPNDWDKGYYFGTNYDEGRPGVTVKRFDNRFITWERSRKANYGLEATFFNDLSLQVDYFTERRNNILMNRASIPANMGLAVDVRSNVGEAKANGVDLSMDYNKYFKNGYWLQARANFTYAHSEYSVYEEPTYKEYYRSRVGRSLKQEYGYIAERLFIDEYDVQNSPRQSFGEYGAGDIKYRDVNGDGQITQADMVPLGYPTVPEIVYGFGFSFGNKRIDVSAFFQGSARSSFWIDAEKTSPFQHINPDPNGDNFHQDIPLLKAYADDHWSESNRNLYAMWPRLSTSVIKNNIQKSSWFMRNGAFLRMKSLEVGYTLPEQWIKKAFLSSARVYCSGTNLFLISGFKLWDIEMGGSGLGYPLQRVINLGVQVNF